MGVVSPEGKITSRFSEKSLTLESVSVLGCRVWKGKELNDFQRNLLDIEIL